jgi:biofilm PGA synthesis protein PgaA
LDIALHADPTNRNALLAKYYLQLDAEDFAAVEQTLAQMRASATTPSQQRVDRLLTAQLAAYTSHLEEAQMELEALRAEEPQSLDIRQRLALLYRWRGWPRRALAEYQAAEKLAPEDTSNQLGKVAALADMRSFKEADATLQAVASNAPTSSEVATAITQRQQRAQWQYSSQVTVGQAGSNPVSGTNSIAFDQRLFSAPIADQFRLYARHHYDWAEFPEGSGHLNLVGLGVDYRSKLLNAALELNRNALVGGLGITLSSEWHFNDEVSVFAAAQADNSAAPLRGLRANVTGDSYNVGARYRPDERSQSQISYSLGRFSDDNEREALSFTHQHAFYLQGRQQIRLIAQAYFGHSSIGENVPYYNPKSEKVGTLTVEYSGLLGASQDNWSHRVAVGAGGYQQESFSTTAIWDVEYEQRLRFTPDLDINYGLLYRNRVYAGQREGYSAFFGGLNWRF